MKAKQRLFSRVASLPVLGRCTERHCQFPGCTRAVEAQGHCGFHLHVTFLQKLKERLRQSYGSTAKAANYFQDLLGDMVTFQDFCELLRFLRIPFKDDEAKSFFAEVGGSRSNSLMTSYQTIVLREYLETTSPPKTADVPHRKSPLPVHKQTKTRFVTTSEECLGVDSSDFHTPQSPSHCATPFEAHSKTRHLLYFLRDALEHLFSAGAVVVTFADFEKTLEGFQQRFDIVEVREVFAQAEDGSGVVTRDSFKEFWGKVRDVSGVAGNPFVAMLFKKLRTAYDSFLAAYEDITQGGTIPLDASQIQRLSSSLSLTPTPYDLQFLLSTSPLSLHAFKCLWLNELHSCDLKYCQSRTCTEAVLFDPSLCHKHKTYIQSQGSYVWTLVKGSLQPRKTVQLISHLNAVKDESAFTPGELRTVLMRFMPGMTLPQKDLTVLAEYLRLRLKKNERKSNRAESSPVFSPPQISVETKLGSFFNKTPWTPNAAGFSKTSVSRKGLRSPEAHPGVFQFPYPHAAPPSSVR